MLCPARGLGQGRLWVDALLLTGVGPGENILRLSRTHKMKLDEITFSDEAGAEMTAMVQHLYEQIWSEKLPELTVLRSALGYDDAGLSARPIHLSDPGTFVLLRRTPAKRLPFDSAQGLRRSSCSVGYSP